VRIVIALGGNALLERGDRPDHDIQERNTAIAVAALVPLVRNHDVIVTHGNGPQVGVLAIESASGRLLRRPYPLDTLGPKRRGLIGYWFVQELRNRLPNAGSRHSSPRSSSTRPTRHSRSRRSSSARCTAPPRLKDSHVSGGGTSPQTATGGGAWSRHRRRFRIVEAT
jgi:hypothetical protein